MIRPLLWLPLIAACVSPVLSQEASPEKRAQMDPESFETVLDPSEILIEPRRGEIVEPIIGTPDFGASTTTPEEPVTEEE